MPQGVPDPTTITTRQGFAQALTTLREQAGLTVREVARISGIQASTAGGYFGGRHLPPLGTPGVLAGLLSACGVTGPAQDAWREALLRVRRTPAQRPSSSPAPYRGLASFQPEDAAWFFGREELVDALVSRVAAAARRLAVGTSRGLVVVVGASGSGKSSLLRAGLIPALERGAIDGGPWSWLLLTPGADPPAELSRRLGADTDPGSDLAVVIDQFEELFTTCPDAEKRHAFVSRVLSLSRERTGRTVVVAGLRADFYGHATRLPGLVNALQDSQLVVGPMTAAQLRRAIAEPARRAQVSLEDGLIDLVLESLAPSPVGTPTGWTSAAAHDPGALPLLSHALLATWQRGRQATLQISDYVAAGGIQGSVARTADEVFQALTPQQQDAARRLFRRLVSVADGTADTRRRVCLTELGPTAQDPDSPLHVVLGEFVRNRLLTCDTDGVEITHDALLVAWPQLRSWVDADRVGLSTHRQLTAAAHAWDASGRDPQNLYRGGRLSAAQEWAADAGHAGELSPVEGAFLTAARERADAEQRAQQRTTRRLRWLAASLVTLLPIVAGLGGYALYLTSAATHDRDLATSRQIAVEAQRLRGTDIASASQLGVLALRTSDTAQARSAVLDAAAMPLATRLIGPPGVLQSVSVMTGGPLVAAGGERGVVRLWSVPPDGHPQRSVDLSAGGGTLFATALSPRGHLLAAAGTDRRVRLWDVSAPGHPVPVATSLTGPTGAVLSLAFSPDGRLLAAGSADRTVRLWDLRDRTRPRALPTITGPTDAVQAVAFSPDGHLLACAGADRLVRLWDVTRPGRPLPLRGGAGLRLVGATSTLFSVAFAPDGRTLAGSTRDGSVLLWSLARPPRGTGAVMAPTTTLTGPTSWVNAVAFSPDGRRLAAASSGGRTWVWNAASGHPLARLPHPAPVTAVAWRGPGLLFTGCADGNVRGWSLPGAPALGLPGPVYSVGFSRDGRRLAAGSLTRTALWDVTDPDRPQQAGPGVAPGPAGGAMAGASALSPDGTVLALGTRSGMLLLWDLTVATRPVRLAAPVPVSRQHIEWLTFSPDGRTIALGSDDGTVRLVDIHDRGHPALSGTALTGPDTLVLGGAFSPDGHTLAAGTADRSIWLWDVGDVQAPKALGDPLRGPDSYVYGVAFSPDGRLLAAGTADHSVWLWDITDRQHPHPLGEPLTGPLNYIYSVAFSPDGRLLAAGAGDHSVWVWDVGDPTAPTVRETLTDAEGAVYAVAFSPDGRTLAAGSGDQAVWLWPVDTDRAVDRICAAVGNPLTAAEWRLSVPGLPYRTIC